MSSIGDAIEELHAAALPVLFIDTCSLLDVIRAPARPDQLKGCVRGATELHRFATGSPLSCRLVVASQVPDEWNQHANAEATVLRKHLAKLDESIADFHAACELLGLPAFASSVYSNIRLPEHLFLLSQRLLDTALHLDAQDNTDIRALRRAKDRIPPSKRGGEVKDCIILEECLEVATGLRAAGFTRRIVFCTSNTDDYCEGTQLHPAIASDFAPLGVVFTKNLTWAVHELFS